jgi:hypothetical protein
MAQSRVHLTLARLQQVRRNGLKHIMRLPDTCHSHPLQASAARRRTKANHAASSESPDATKSLRAHLLQRARSMRSSTPASGHAKQRACQSCVRSPGRCSCSQSAQVEQPYKAREGRRQEKNSARCNWRFHASECHLRAGSTINAAPAPGVSPGATSPII